MLSITLGPLALPVAPLLWLGATWSAAALARRLAGADAARRAERLVWAAAATGLLAARAAYLLSHTQPYLATPWAAIDLRDGGWHVPAGLAAGALALLLGVWRSPALRRPVAIATLGGAAVWAAGAGAARLAGGMPALDRVPSVAVRGLAGEPSAMLPELAAGAPAVINLWASWCGPCRAEMPALVRARQRHPGVRFLLVDQGEAAAVVRAYLEREGLPTDGVWLDAASALGPAVGSRGLPTTLFFDAGGRRVDAHFGALNAAALEARLRDLQAR